MEGNKKWHIFIVGLPF